MSIAILGLGWLGIPLAQELIKKGCKVKGSTTTEAKISNLKSLGIDAHCIQLTATDIKGNISSFLENCSELIIDIPPQLLKDKAESYVDKIKILIPEIEKSSIKKVIFISSTSVFSDSNQLVTEDTDPYPDTESGKQVWEVEQLLHQSLSFDTLVIRFGGLIGDDRHPVYFFAGKKDLEHPEAPVNLIHLLDCVSIISLFIFNPQNPKSINAVAPQHPSRKSYYTQKAIELNLALPNFKTQTKSIGKRVYARYLIEHLGYQFVKKI
jgi:nucleoside-diphosphate-sugar epimerase